MTSKYQILSSGGVWDTETRSVILSDNSSALWLAYEVWLTAGNTPLPADTVGQDTLDVTKQKRLAEIDAYAAGQRNLAVRGRSAAEMSGWLGKLLDAMAVRAAQPSPFAAVLPTICTQLGLVSATSYNHVLAQIRGITEAAHVTKVIDQAVPFLVMEAALDGNRGKHCDAILAMTTVQQVILYNWRVGWPVITP